MTGFMQTLCAQVTQRGFVYEYTEEGTRAPLANVEIVVANAGSTVTNAKGEFTLRFQKLKPGDKVTVRYIRKPGYELLNPEVLDQWFVAGDGTPYSIVVAKSSMLAAARMKVSAAAQRQAETQYTVAREHLQDQYKKNQADEAQYQQKLQQLEEDYAHKLRNIETYIDRFVRIDKTKLTQTEQEAVDLVSKGEFDEALALYENADLLARYKQQTENLHQLDSDTKALEKAHLEMLSEKAMLKEALNRQIVLLRMKGGKENLDHALTLLHDMAFTDPDDVEPMFYYIKILYQMGYYKEAREVCHTMSEHHYAKSDNVIHYGAQLYESIVLQAMGEKDAGDSLLHIAFDNLANSTGGITDSVRYLWGIAIGCENLGERYCAKFQYKEGYDYLMNGLKALRRALDIDHLHYSETKGRYANLLVTASAALCQSEYVDECRTMVQQGIEMLTPKYNRSPYLYVGDLAFAWDILGLTEYIVGDNYDKAESAFLTGLKYYEAAAERNPLRCLPRMARCSHHLGDLYYSRRDWSRAISYYEKSRDIWTENATEERTFEDEISEVYFDLGSCHYFLADYKKALEYDIIALDRTEPLYYSNPTLFGSQMSMCLRHLANVYNRMNQYELALVYCRRAIVIEPTHSGNRALLNELQQKVKHNSQT